MYRTGNPAITGDLGKGGGWKGGGGHHHHGGGFRSGRGIYESAFVFPYDVCFTNCVERGIPVAACRTRCSFQTGNYGYLGETDAAGAFASAIAPVAVGAVALWFLFGRKKR